MIYQKDELFGEINKIFVICITITNCYNYTKKQVKLRKICIAK